MAIVVTSKSEALKRLQTLKDREINPEHVSLTGDVCVFKFKRNNQEELSIWVSPKAHYENGAVEIRLKGRQAQVYKWSDDTRGYEFKNQRDAFEKAKTYSLRYINAIKE